MKWNLYRDQIMRINFFDCIYHFYDNEQEDAVLYLCEHPENIDGDCPLNNKKTGQKDECAIAKKQ